MARDQYTEKRKAQPGHVVAAIVSVIGSLATYYVSRQQLSTTEGESKARQEFVRVTREEIRNVCKELVLEERERTKEREEQLRESIDFLMRYYRRR